MQLFVLIQTSTIFISCGYPHWCQLEGRKAEVNGNNKILLDNRTVCFWTLYPYSSRPPVSTEGMLTFTLPGEGIPSLKGRTRMHTYACTLTQTYRPPPPNTSDACLLCCEMWWFMRYVLNHHITSIITLSMLTLRKLIIQQKLNSLPNFEWGCGLFVC